MKRTFPKCCFALSLPVALLLASLSGIRPTRACIAIGSDGQPIRVASEQALIVWDEKTHTEHFLRQATFDAKNRDFGFLVPTPTRPELAEADPQIFNKLDRSSNTLYALTGGSHDFHGSIPAPTVQIVSTQQVAGYEAVTLKAQDAAGLKVWLEVHGYRAEDRFVQWLKPYLREHWFITAFKIAKQNENASRVTSAAVRMSFHTGSPFYPYREPQERDDPKSENTNHRELSVYFCGNIRFLAKMRGTKRAWVGQTTRNVPLSDALIADIKTALKLSGDVLPSGSFLTKMEDYSFPRNGKEDLVFYPVSDRIKTPAQTALGGGALQPIDVGAFLFRLDPSKPAPILWDRTAMGSASYYARIRTPH